MDTNTNIKRVFGVQEDFSKTFVIEPEIVFDTKGKTTEEISAFIKVHYDAGKKINLRGSGHSTNKRNVGNEVLISNFEDTLIPELKEDSIEISTAANLEYLEDYLQKNGKHLVCLQDWTRLTIGGSICVGGAGWESAKYGTQANQVESLQVILPSGEVVKCDKNENRNLFLHTLAGLGMTGFIRSVKIKIYDYLPFYGSYTTCFSSLEDYFKYLPSIIEKFWTDDLDLLNGGVHLKMYKEARISYGKRFLTGEEAKAWNGQIEDAAFKYTFKKVNTGLPAKMPREILENLQDYQLWCDFALPSLDSIKLVLSECLGKDLYSSPIKQWNEQTSILKNLVYITFGYVRNVDPKIPLGMVPANCGELAHTVGFAYNTASKSDISKIQEGCDYLKMIVQKHGGRSYNYGFHSFTEQDALRMYGNDWITAQQLMLELDPRGTWNKVNTIPV